MPVQQQLNKTEASSPNKQNLTGYQRKTLHCNAEVWKKNHLRTGASDTAEGLMGSYINVREKPMKMEEVLKREEAWCLSKKYELI